MHLVGCLYYYNMINLRDLRFKTNANFDCGLPGYDTVKLGRQLQTLTSKKYVIYIFKVNLENPEKGSSTFHRNVGTHLQDCTVP